MIWSKNKNICVIGAGKWGLNHVRTLAELNALGAVVDLNVEVLIYHEELYQNAIFMKI